MYRRKFLLVLLLVSFVSSAYGAVVANIEERDEPSIITGEQLLYDLTYLMQAMEEGFMQLGHAYRKFGVDVREQGAMLAERIKNNPYDLDKHEFYELLREYIFTPGLHRAGSNSWAMTTSNVDVLSRCFYLELFLRTSQAEPGTYQRFVHQTLSNPASVLFYTGLEAEPGFRDAVIDLAIQNHPYFMEAVSGLPIVVTNILEDGNIAYISVDWMGPNPIQDPAFFDALENRIFAFYDSLSDFGHLIIDLRNNMGGFLPFAERNLIGPHMSGEPVSLDIYAFFSTCARVRRFVAYTYPLSNFPRTPVTDMLAEGMFSYMNPYDVANLAYGFFNRQLTFAPTAHRSPFNGQIWLLTNEETGSAAEITAHLAREAGVAVIVGEQTRGNFGKTTGQGNLLFLALPNTGIIVTWDPMYFTDSYGRHLHEYYVIPDIFNHPGMDALETALALIADGFVPE